MERKPKVVYRIIDHPANDDAAPYALVTPDEEIVRVGASLRELADYAFDFLGADEVRHDEDLIKADSRFRLRKEP